MGSAIRYARGNARMHALKSAMWGALDRDMLLHAGADPRGQPLTGTFDALFPPLVRWYEVLIASYPFARPLFLALFRLHELENVKLLWRMAVRRRPLVAACWRPLAPLATLSLAHGSSSPEELVESLEATPYGAIARTVLRSHGGDLPAVEMGFDRWAYRAVAAEASKLAQSESAARDLLLMIVRERDVDMLRRGVATYGLAADLVAKSTVVLSRECPLGALVTTAGWEPSWGPLSSVLPTGLLRAAGPVVEDWDALVLALRRSRRRACGRAFVGWPYQLAPAVAALLLREEEVRVAITLSSLAAAGTAGHRAVPLVMAASAVEA